MSQPVRVDVVPGCVHRDSVRIELFDRVPQWTADRGVIANEGVEYVQPRDRILFEVPNDGDSFTLAREDQRRGPGQIVGSDQEIQRRIQQERAEFDAILRRLRLLCVQGFLSADTEAQIYLEGAPNLVGAMESLDGGQVRKETSSGNSLVSLSMTGFPSRTAPDDPGIETSTR